MNSGITSTFVLIGVSLIFWSVAASLSTYLASDFERQQKNQTAHSAEVIPGPQDVEQLREAVAQKENDADAKVRLGYVLIKQAREQSKSEYLMEAVQVFNKALKLESEHPAALLGLAALSLQAGGH